MEFNWVTRHSGQPIGPIVPAPGDYDDGETGGIMIGRGNRSTWRKNLSQYRFVHPKTHMPART
jgi:hypothetical protein